MTYDIDVERAERIIQYVFQDKRVLAEALTAPHRNNLETGGMETTDGNRRLATLGERVLNLVIAEYWYDSGYDQGMLSLHLSLEGH